MIVTAKWEMNSDYFNKYWDDWITYKSEGRVYVVPVGFILVVIGIIFSFVTSIDISYLKQCGGFLIVLGITITSWHYWEKQHWLNKMIQDSTDGTELVMVFNEEGIKTKSPISSGEATWKIVKKIVPAKNGIFFVLKKGISIYIPKQSISAGNTMEEIIKLYEESNA